jgi:hypothetical protein
MTGRFRSLARLPLVGLLLLTPGLLSPVRPDARHPQVPRQSSAAPFADEDTVTTVSLTTTIGPGCSLVLWDHRQKRQYGPGDSVHLEIKRGFATVNDLRVYQPRTAPPPDWPLEDLQRGLSSNPFVQDYVRTHSGSPQRVWNDAKNAWDVAVTSLDRQASTRYRAMVQHGLPSPQIADSVRQRYLSSPLVLEATTRFLDEASTILELRVRFVASSGWTVIHYGNSPPGSPITLPTVLTAKRASALRAVIQSLSGDKGPAEWEIGFGGPSAKPILLRW